MIPQRREASVGGSVSGKEALKATVRGMGSALRSKVKAGFWSRREARAALNLGRSDHPKRELKAEAGPGWGCPGWGWPGLGRDHGAGREGTDSREM